MTSWRIRANPEARPESKGLAPSTLKSVIQSVRTVPNGEMPLIAFLGTKPPVVPTVKFAALNEAEADSVRNMVAFERAREIAAHDEQERGRPRVLTCRLKY